MHQLIALCVATAATAAASEVVSAGFFNGVAGLSVFAFAWAAAADALYSLGFVRDDEVEELEGGMIP